MITSKSYAGKTLYNTKIKCSEKHRVMAQVNSQLSTQYCMPNLKSAQALVHRSLGKQLSWVKIKDNIQVHVLGGPVSL